jgi:DNA processing protein
MPLPPEGLEPDAWLTLDLISGLGGERTRKLLSEFGAPANALAQSATSLSRVVGQKLALSMLDQVNSETLQERLRLSRKWLEGEHNHLLTLADSDYPRQLLEIADPPPVLYLKGRRELLLSPSIAVVGSRNATPGGMQNAEAFSKALSEAGFTIISGMALGIDAAAHRGGLAGRGGTIAVVGTGLDLVYPARNKALAHDISTHGLIVSEFSLGTPALANNFPRRNRIISGLSRGVLVVEAALQSGSLITARQAGEQGREVFAIPGSIHSPFSKGTHQLIKQGAKLVDDAQDILSELTHTLPTSTVTPISSTLQDDEALPEPIDGATARDDDAVVRAMGFDAFSVDELATRTGASAQSLMAKLTELELMGQIAALPGGKYQRLA